MKYFAALVLLVACVYADDEWHVQTHDDLIKYRGECVTTLNVSEEQVAQYKKWSFADDEKTHSYIRCIFNKMGLFDDTTGFQIEHLVKQLGQNRDADDTRAEVIKCSKKELETDNEATWAYKGLICFRNAHLDLIQSSVKN